MHPYAAAVAAKLNIRPAQADSVLQLLEEGATIPFISRYRKDRTGALDEVQVQQVQDEAKGLKDLDDRRAVIIKSINEQGKMTPELQAKLDKAEALSTLEDIYLPYKPKRKTKGLMAREKGLEPLALWLMEPGQQGDPLEQAKGSLNEQVATPEEALQGARDIIAENISEDASVRADLRRLFEREGRVCSVVVEGKQEEAQKFRDYFEYDEPLHKIPSHRALAVLRGFLEGVLRMSIEPEEGRALETIAKHHRSGGGAAGEQLRKAQRDAWKRLLQPGLETEMRTGMKQKADEEAIHVFAENLRQLLLGSPLGQRRVMALDPGYRTGCKLVCLDAQGELLENAVIYIHEKNRLQDAEHTVRRLVVHHQIEVFAIGDGTAGRETEQFIRNMQLGMPIFLVNEDGASVYSASETAREEFPDQDVTVRGAVSIGRRLMDPLAELVKIDPKSIGVGQYQHDVNQGRLREKLDQTVVRCVNQVGVNLNTASRHLLAYVSGINSSIASNIVAYRKEKGAFSDRSQLKQVPRLGEKAFEQAAGFLRIMNGAHPLDGSAVHPEAYGVVERMAADLGVGLAQLIGNEGLLGRIDPRKYADEKVGALTLADILKELKKPGLDPRSEARPFEYAAIFSIDDVQSGMVVPGIVTNLTRFGAFVDIGVKQDGLVHISEISRTYISDPGEKLKLNDVVQVKVLEVDRVRKRIALSIKQAGEAHADLPGRGKKPLTARPDKPGIARSEPDMKDALAQLRKKFGK